MLFVAACSGGVTPRPAIETVPIREGIDTTSPDGGTSAASSSEPDSPEPTKKGASKPSAPPPKAPAKKPPPKKGR
jgi:hypothetical protein